MAYHCHNLTISKPSSTKSTSRAVSHILRFLHFHPRLPQPCWAEEPLDLSLPTTEQKQPSLLQSFNPSMSTDAQQQQNNHPYCALCIRSQPSSPSSLNQRSKIHQNLADSLNPSSLCRHLLPHLTRTHPSRLSLTQERGCHRCLLAPQFHNTTYIHFLHMRSSDTYASYFFADLSVDCSHLFSNRHFLRQEKSIFQSCLSIYSWLYPVITSFPAKLYFS